jgi:hypothetical protein
VLVLLISQDFCLRAADQLQELGAPLGTQRIKRGSTLSMGNKQLDHRIEIDRSLLG